MVDRTAEELQNSLHNERKWRRLEISTTKSRALTAGISDESAICRAFWLLQYAHWEGFVKAAVERYLCFVAMRNLKFSELQNGFRLLPNSPLYSAIHQIQKKDQDKLAALSKIMMLGEQRLTKRHVEISTKSNLRWDVLKNLSDICCVDLHSFVDTAYLNIILADRRNEIAHGQWLKISKNDVQDVRDTCANWMDQILNNLVNAAAVEGYKCNPLT